VGADADTDGRGVGVGPLKGDGRIDVVMSNNNAPPTVYANRLRCAGHWTRMTLTGRSGNRDAIGAVVRLTVKRPDGTAKTMTRQVEAGSGYASQSDFAVHFGLGPATAVEAVEVLWPGGDRQVFRGAELDGLVDRAVRLVEGEGFTPLRAGERWQARR
jgi:enediyne biosynthesis protein E4